ncbi:Spy/CpxP family protein refolding chaperone [Enhydrobacter sp.]|jgi:cell pole-organizing protein PopZ|uniref:Spy/CpxP family protein refolding chaperone n=1 Tax=Enhydrobacter sp. TaxID=1894999 RepID=UPI002628EFDC|nr:Spy/CpxP family protein refolding chaperone [Enhydrobacter sp.]WIM12735.1 MAG: hypothetical protein OJF58_003698 [Enhydrobacter sp.]
MTRRPLFVAVPTALVAAAGLAWLTSASASDGGFERAPQIAQATPPAAPAPPPAAGGPEHMKHMMQHQAFSPQKTCLEEVARRIGNRAYLKARLDLKPEQTEAWNAFEKAADAASAKEKTRCAGLPATLDKRPDFAQRLEMRESYMKARLDTIEAVKPSLLTLYGALTPEQKEILDRSASMGMHHHRG